MDGRYGHCWFNIVVELVVVSTTMMTVKEGDSSIWKVNVVDQRTRVRCIHKTNVVWYVCK